MSSNFDIKTILIPVDFSDTSRKAFYIGLKYARLFEATTHVLHVKEPISYFDSSFEKMEEVSAELTRFEAGVRRRVNDLFEHGGVKEIDRRKIKVAVAAGKPHIEIVKFASESNCDLIIMGSHGYTGVKSILIGNVAERVVRFAPCQVLCVKPDDYEPPVF